MPCEKNIRLLNGYFDNELDVVHGLEFEQHLTTCFECSGNLDRLRELRASLKSASLYENAPAGLAESIRGQLPHQEKRTALPMHLRPAFQWISVAAVLVIAAVVGGKFMGGMNRQSLAEHLLSEEIISSHIRSLQPGHLYDVQSTDQHTVKPWFDGKLDFAPQVTNLAANGFPLLGGRLDYLDHRSVAALVYQRQKHLINVLVWPEDSQSSSVTVPKNTTIEGYNLICWQHAGMDFCAVSDLNMAELQELHRLLE